MHMHACRWFGISYSFTHRWRNIITTLQPTQPIIHSKMDHKIQCVERIDDILICCSAGQCPVSEAIIHTPGNVTCETSIQYTCVTPRDVLTWMSSAFDLDVAVAAGTTIPQPQYWTKQWQLIEATLIHVGHVITAAIYERVSYPWIALLRGQRCS